MDHTGENVHQSIQNTHFANSLSTDLYLEQGLSYILAGYSVDDYDPLVTSLLPLVLINPISMKDLYGHLLTHEQHIY
jgi:hypothetical protein